MADHYGLSLKEKKFIRRWSAVRAKGKVRYIVTRGLLFGLGLFAVWFIVTWIEINMSDFKRAVIFQDYDSFLRRCMIWFVCEMIIGFVIASGVWKRKEERLEYLS